MKAVGLQNARKRLDKLERALSPESVDRLLNRVAAQTRTELVKATPRKWFGQVRAAWKVESKPSVKVIRNDNRIMLFLEEGTRAHGPKEIFGPLKEGQARRKKLLFIPKTRRAAAASADIAMGAFTRATSGKPGILIKANNKRGYSKLIYGVDYILTPRVRGIKARHIVRDERPRTMQRLVDGAKTLIKGALSGPV